jgi:hypothetical protein
MTPPRPQDPRADLRSLAPIAIAGAAAVLAAIFLWIPGVVPPKVEAGPDAPSAGSVRAGDAIPPPVLDAEARESEDERGPEPRPPGSDRIVAATVQEPPLDDSWTKFGGRLCVRAVDAESGRPVRRFRVRAASATRLADSASAAGSPEVVFVLTPGRYSLLVLSPGYEPAEAGPVALARGDAVELEPVPLHPGTARLVGVVVGGPVDPGTAVELHGEGRHPCPRCAAESHTAGLGIATKRESPCPACGYARGRTRVPVSARGEFTTFKVQSVSHTTPNRELKANGKRPRALTTPLLHLSTYQLIYLPEYFARIESGTRTFDPVA